MSKPVVKKKLVEHYLYSGLGGHGSVFFSLVEADKEREFDYRAYFCGIEELRTEYQQQCERLDIPYTYLKKKRGVHAGAYFKVFGNFFKHKPRVVFLHGVGFSIVSALWYKITKPGARILVRDTQAHHLKSRAEWFWMFWCLLFAKRMVVLTDASAQGIKKKFGWWAPSRKLVVIPNGLNMEKYQPRPKQEGSKQQLIIGMQSRLQPIKDHPTLLKAFKQVKHKLPNISLALHIAGDGETMPQIKALIRELGIEQDVVLHGMLNEQELLTFMQTLDIYIHATFGETLSNSIMQAMASGLPIIASDVWGVNNMIVQGKTGIMYTSQDEGQLAGCMEEFITSPAKRQRFGEQARAFAMENYSNLSMFKRYTELYGA